MNEKKYLNLKDKMAYGSGDMASNFCYTFVSSFMLIYLTNTVGLKAGIIGTLMMFSRIFDGVSDVFAGTVIDRTKHRLGKARSWMLWTVVPVALCQILLFNIPSMGETVQYVYFFIVYTLLNAVFYTLNNVAYSTLAVLITPNKEERVQLGVFRFIFTMIAAMIVSGGTISFVKMFGGGVQGWRATSIIFSLLFIIVSLICVLPLHELPESELGVVEEQEKTNVLQNLKYLLRNRYFVMQLLIGIFYNTLMNLVGSVGVYYMTYVLKDDTMLGVFTIVQMIPMIAGLSITPVLVKKWGIYKTNLIGFGLTVFSCIPFLIFGMNGMIVPMLVFHAIGWFGRGPQVGNGTALNGEICRNIYMKEHKHLEGAVFSCGTVGVKVGAGLGTALAGWMLQATHFDGTLAVQPSSAEFMIKFMYAAMPLIISIVIFGLLVFLNVEKENEQIGA